MRPECKLNGGKRRLRVSNSDLYLDPDLDPEPRLGIVWFNSGPAFIYTCGGIILQLLKIMSAERRLNQGQWQLPLQSMAMASFRFMDISFALLYFLFFFILGPLPSGSWSLFLRLSCLPSEFVILCLLYFFFSCLSWFLFCLSSRGILSFIWLARKLGPCAYIFFCLRK